MRDVITRIYMHRLYSRKFSGKPKKQRQLFNPVNARTFPKWIYKHFKSFRKLVQREQQFKHLVDNVFIDFIFILSLCLRIQIRK